MNRTINLEMTVQFSLWYFSLSIFSSLVRIFYLHWELSQDRCEYLIFSALALEKKNKQISAIYVCFSRGFDMIIKINFALFALVNG